MKISTKMKSFFSDVNVKAEMLRTLVAIAISIAVLIVLLFIMSDDPFFAINQMFIAPISSEKEILALLNKAIPLTFTGLAVALVFSSGNFNLSVEGAFYTGGLLAMMLSFAISVPAIIFWLILIIITAIIGSLIVGFPGYFKNKWEASEIVTSLMLNSILFFFGTYILVTYYVPVGSSSIASDYFPEAYLISTIIFFTIAALLVVGVSVLMYSTRTGFNIRITGKNRVFAKTIGINTKLTSIQSQLIGGAIACVGGALYTLNSLQRFTSNATPGYGWDGIVVAVMARNNPRYIPLAALFMGYIKQGATILNRRTDVPYEIVMITQAVIMVLIVSVKLISKLQDKMIMKSMKGAE